MPIAELVSVTILTLLLRYTLHVPVGCLEGPPPQSRFRSGSLRAQWPHPPREGTSLPLTQPLSPSSPSLSFQASEKLAWPSSAFSHLPRCPPPIPAPQGPPAPPAATLQSPPTPPLGRCHRPSSHWLLPAHEVRLLSFPPSLARPLISLWTLEALQGCSSALPPSRPVHSQPLLRPTETPSYTLCLLVSPPLLPWERQIAKFACMPDTLKVFQEHILF